MRSLKKAGFLPLLASAAVAVALSTPVGAQQTPSGPSTSRGQTQTDEHTPRRGLDAIEVRDRLKRLGYTDIANVDFVGEVEDDHFVADATKGGQRYRLKIDDDYGRILETTRLE